MVKDKKGFIRILEAIIALMLIFGYVITILPKAPKNISKAPPEIESALEEITSGIQTNERLRASVLESNNIHQVDVTASGILNTFIKESFPAVTLHVWDYAFSVCAFANNRDCVFFPQKDTRKDQAVELNDLEAFQNYVSLSSSSVYTRTALISAHDVTSSPLTPKTSAENRIFTIYIWTKI